MKLPVAPAETLQLPWMDLVPDAVKAQQGYEEKLCHDPLVTLIQSNPPRARELKTEYDSFLRRLESWREAATSPEAAQEYLQLAKELAQESTEPPNAPDLRILKTVAHQTHRAFMHPEVARKMLAIFEAWEAKLAPQVNEILGSNPRITGEWKALPEPQKEFHMDNPSKMEGAWEVKDFQKSPTTIHAPTDVPPTAEKRRGWVRTQLAKRLPRMFG